VLNICQKLKIGIINFKNKNMRNVAYGIGVGMEDNRIIIARLANGWSVALPLNYPDSSEMLEDHFMQANEDPLLKKIRNSIKGNTTNKPSVGEIPALPNVFIFTEFDDLLNFLKEKVK
jgi:hypothetical protein